MISESSQAGDLLAIAHETADARQRLSLLLRAAQLLSEEGHHEFALEQVDAMLSLDPGNLAAHQEKALLLARLRKFAAAREIAESIVNDHPKDAHSWSLLGQVEKAEWVARWRRPGFDKRQMRERAMHEIHLHVQAIEPFHAAISLDPGDFSSGASALKLRHLLFHLSGSDHHPVSLQRLREAVRHAANAAIKKNRDSSAAHASLAELLLLQGEAGAAFDEYRVAFAQANRRLLESVERNLSLLDDLEFRPEETEAARAALAAEIAQRPVPLRPEKVFLFSGHMIDRPERETPRFPAACEATAAQAISLQLDALAAGPSDLAVCGGACGGDLLFAEDCLRRGMLLTLYLPFAEHDFLQASVAFAGSRWVERYREVKENPLTRVRVMPAELGDSAESADPYSRNNLWQLYSALCHGPERVRFIALWNGEAADGPGGTKHMVESVEKHSGQAYILDTKILCHSDV